METNIKMFTLATGHEIIGNIVHDTKTELELENAFGVACERHPQSGDMQLFMFPVTTAFTDTKNKSTKITLNKSQIVLTVDYEHISNAIVDNYSDVVSQVVYGIERISTPSLLLS